MDGDDLTSVNIFDHPVLVIARKLATGEGPGSHAELALWREIVDDFLRQQLAYACWWLRLQGYYPRPNDPLGRVHKPKLSVSQLWRLRQLWRVIGERCTVRQRG